MVTRRIRKHPLSKVAAFVVMVALNFAYISPALAVTLKQRRNSQHANTRIREHANTLPVRVLRLAEMKQIVGAGPYRDKSLCGQLPWWPFYKNVNLVTGNLYRSYTDLSYPSRAMNVAFTRIYNSNEDAVGPFGKGWQFSYDLALYTDPQDPVGTLDRQTWNGAQLPYQIDADGLVTPPVYVHDKTAYTKTLARINTGQGAPVEVILEYDIEGNRTDNNPIPAGETDEFQLEFTRAAKDGSKTTYYAFGKDPGGNPTGYYKATRIEDRNGNAMTFQYNQAVTYPDGSTDKLLTSVTDTVGRTTTINWTNLGDAQTPAWRVTSMVDPIGRQWTYAYNAEKNLSSVTDPAGRTTTYGYTSLTGPLGTEEGLLTTETSPLGRTMRYIYKWRGDLGGCPNFEPPDPIGFLWVGEIIEPSGYASKISFGGPNCSKDPQNWDRLYRLFAPSVAETGPSGRWWHDVYGRACVWHIPNMIGPPLETRQWNNAFQVTTITHSVNGPQGPSDPHAQWSRTTTLTYDTVFDPQGNVVEPGQGNVLTQAVASQGTTYNTTTFTYYNETKYHQQASQTDQFGRVTRFDYFASDDPNPGNRGNLKTVTDAKGGVTEFTYNPYGQKATMKDAEGRVWSYSYNAHGDLTRLTYPDGSYTETTYDAIGRPTQVRDRKGQITTIQYNVVGQPTRIDYLADNTSVTYTYNNDGQVTSVTDARGVTTYTYEGSTGRLLSVTDPVVGTVSYEYDLYGSRTKVTMPNGRATRFTYRYTSGGAAGSYAANAHNTALDNWQCEMVADPTDLTDADGKKTPLSLDTDGRPLVADSAMTTDAGGNPVTRATSEWFYDGRGQLSEARASLTGITNPLKYAYTYDDMGNRVTHTKTEENNQSRTESYGYDELSRLTSVTYGDGVTQTYTFDKVGNRLTKTEGGNTTTYTYNSVNELTSSSEGSYTYDANGNTLTDAQGRTYVWDQQNRLKQVTKNGVTTTFTYRFDGLRASKTVNGVTTNYVYDGQTVVGEVRSDGTSSWYTPGANGYISRTDLDSAGNVTNKEWFVYDGLGSCRAMVKPNAQGTEAVIVARYDYDVYGAVRTQSGSSANQFKYVAGIGHPTDEETGLIYMRARYYELGAGRFVSEDPARDGSNWYAYVEDNPVNRVDPTGKFLVEFVLTWLIDGETETFQVQVDLQTARVLTRRIESIVARYNARLVATFRSTLGATDDGIAAYIRIYNAAGQLDRVVQVVWNPWTGQIVHEHMLYYFYWFW